MNHTFESHDGKYLADLMREFPVDSPPEISRALQIIHLRFAKLNVEQFSAALGLLTDSEFANRFGSLPWKMHRYLFQDILSNAGSYRKDTDQKGGIIFFGLNQKFRGTPPPQIPDGVKKACSNLVRDADDPVANAVRFYQQFVCVHPFYDANGRVGRFTTNIYLDYCGLHISWVNMHKNTKWLKKMNACHVRNGDESYMQRLIDHWRKYIVLKEDIAP